MAKEKLVMIPGPTPVAREIQDEMGREIQAFGDPRFIADYKGLIEDLGNLLNCSGQTFVLAGTGTLAMEMAIANTTKAGDRILVVSHGYFGDRFVELCTRKGLEVDVLQAPWGQIIPVSQIVEKLSSQPYAAITVTHVDTATGVAAPIAKIGEMLRQFPDTLYIVDGVCATGAEPEDVDGMNIDILFTGSQKAFGVCPGLLMLWASQKALARRESLGTIPEYYVDFHNWLPVMESPAKYFATPPINLIWALKKSVELIQTEGLENRYVRHQKNAQAARKALESMGLQILAAPSYRAVTLSNLLYPEGIDDAAFRAALSAEGVVVAGGLGAYAGRMFRLGHMGNIEPSDMIAALAAIERVIYALAPQQAMGRGVGIYMSEMGQ